MPIQGVVSVVQHFDMHALSSSLRLHCHSATQVGKVPGWLFSSADIFGLEIRRCAA